MLRFGSRVRAWVIWLAGLALAVPGVMAVPTPEAAPGAACVVQADGVHRHAPELPDDRALAALDGGPMLAGQGLACADGASADGCVSGHCGLCSALGVALAPPLPEGLHAAPAPAPAERRPGRRPPPETPPPIG